MIVRSTSGLPWEPALLCGSLFAALVASGWFAGMVVTDETQLASRFGLGVSVGTMMAIQTHWLQTANTIAREKTGATRDRSFQILGYLSSACGGISALLWNKEPVWLYVLASGIACLILLSLCWIAARNINRAEVQQLSQRHWAVGTFFMLFYLIVGVWLLYPRVRLLRE